MPALNAPPVSPALPSAEMPAAQERSRGYWTSALLRFRRDPVAMGAAVMVLLLIMLAIVGPWITPADPYAASMLKRLKPIGSAAPSWPRVWGSVSARCIEDFRI